MTKTVEIYDTTLRDGTQQEGISLTAGDKLRIARLLDELGVAFVEGGWPGANPKDDEFFARAHDELDLETATLVAFGSTRRAAVRPGDDPQLAALLAARTEAICLVGKAWDYHVEHALRTTKDEAIAMVADSIEYLRSEGRRVFFDAEHFFDGYRANPDFAVAVLTAARRRRCRAARDVRHQRGLPRPRGAEDRGRGHGDRRQRHIRLPLPQRLRHGGRQLHEPRCSKASTRFKVA